MRKDMSYETCSQCGQGQYQETSVHDDWDGVLHCPNCNHEVKRYQEQEKFGVLSDLGIHFQEAVLQGCEEFGCDPNNLTESDWNDLYTHLTEQNFNAYVEKAVDIAAGLWEVRVSFAGYDGF